jgi:WD40 repeat protein
MGLGRSGSVYQSGYFDDHKKVLKHSSTSVSEGTKFFGFEKSKGGSVAPISTQGQNPMKTSNYNEMPLSQYYDNILNSRAKDKTRDSNPMFRSQSLSRPGGAIEKPDINKDIKAFSLPPEVMKFFDEEPIKLAELKHNIKVEKDKVDEILNKLQADINQIIEAKRVSVKSVFDNFLNCYEKSREQFQRKINSFKDTSKILSNNKFGGSSDRLMSLESVEFFDETGKIKEEVCNLKCKLGSLSKEVEKKYLISYSQHLEKEMCHWPHLSNTETAKEYLEDMIKIVKDKLVSNLETLDSVLYKVTPYDFEQIKVRPHVKPSLGESKSNILANCPNLLEITTPFKVEYVQSSFSDKITCLYVIEEDLVATGHSDNSVGIWSMGKGSLVTTLREHTSPVSSLVSIKAYFPEINLTRDAKVESGYLKNRNIKQQNFLISASEGTTPEILLWDLQSWKLIRKFQGHSDTVTSMISLRDGHTVISGSLDCAVKVWDISDDIPVQTIQENENSPVYNMHVFNDYSHFLTAGKSGDMFIYKMSYAYNKRYDRTVFETSRKVKCIKTGGPIFAINETMARDNTIVCGGADRAVSLWNTVTCMEQKRIGAHQTDVIGLVLIENPMKTKANSYVLSFGNYEDRIQITDTSSGETKQMALDEDLSLTGHRYSNPSLQFMPLSDVFGKAKTYLLCSGTKNGSACLVKILIEQEEKEQALTF